MFKELNNLYLTSIAACSALAILAGLLAVPALGQVPFTCEGQALVTQDPRLEDPIDPDVILPVGRKDNYLYVVDTSAWPSAVGFDAVKRLESPAGTPIVVNPVGFRSTDGLLYGWRRGPKPRGMVQIDANGDVFSLGPVNGLPDTEAFVAGGVKPDGSEMYFVCVGTITGDDPLRLYKVPLSDAGPGDATSEPITLGGGSEDPSIEDPGDNVADWAVSPRDGLLYGADLEGHLAILDPTTFERVDRLVENLPIGKGFGAAWFNAAGRLFLYWNDGEIFEIDVAGSPIIVASHTESSSKRNDGAFCIPPPPPFEAPNQPDPSLGADLGTGVYRLPVTDLQIPGTGMDFAWSRTYRSAFAETDEGLGYGWSYSYNIHIEQISGGYMLYSGTGRRDALILQPDGTYAADGFFLTGEAYPNEFIVKHAENTLWIFFPYIQQQFSGGFEKSSVTPPGKIKEILDANGNSLRFSYDAEGDLTSITDTLNREIRVHWNGDHIEQIEAFDGRTITYGYSAGDLTSVTGPPIVGTPNDNDFPGGRTSGYTYSGGFADDRLNHNLLTVIDPLGNTVLRNEYADTTDEADLGFDRLVAQYPGGSPAVIHYAYALVTPGPENGNATKLAITNDRMGNVSESYFDGGRRLVLKRQYTGRAIADQPTTAEENRPAGKLRPADPDFFEERWEYNMDSLRTLHVLANGAHVDRDYSDPYSGARLHRNLEAEGRVAGDFSGQCDPIETDQEFPDPAAPQLPTKRTVSGHTTEFARDQYGNLKRIISPIQSVVEDFDQDERGNVTSHVYASHGGNTRREDGTTYYSGFAGSEPCFGDCPPGAGRRETLTIGAQAGGPGFTKHFEYDAFGNPWHIVDSRGNDNLRDYNAVNELVRTQSRATPAGRHVVDTFYDAAGRVVRSEVSNFDENGDPGTPPIYSVEYGYDVLGNKTYEIKQIDETTSAETHYEYDANGNLVLIRSPESVAENQPANVVERVYDERDLLLRETRAPGTSEASTTEYDYNETGLRVAVRTGIEDGIVRERRMEYDCHGRLVAEIDEMGNRTEYELDEHGNRTHIVTYGELQDEPGSANNVRLAEKVQTFDALERLIQMDDLIFDPLTQSPIGDGVSRQVWNYGDADLLQQKIDDRGNQKTYVYDALRRLVAVTDHRGNVEQYAYDANDNQTQEVETLRSDTAVDRTVVTTTEYDERDRVSRVIDNAGNVQNTEYDSRGNVTVEIDALGNAVRYTYDGMSRRIGTVRELRQGGVGSGGLEDTIDTITTWDLNSRVVERSDDNANAVGYAYDALNRRTAVGYADGTVENSVYDAAGNVVSTVDANGTEVTKGYDLARRLESVTIDPGSGVAADTTFESYVYDGLSRVVSGQNDVSAVTRGYDSLGRMTREVIDGLAPASFDYDGAGNLTSLTYPGGRVVSATYNANNQVASLHPAAGQVLASFSYLGSGLVEQRIYPNGAFPGITTTYLYDELLRMVQSTHARDLVVVDQHAYEWDAQSNLLSRDDVRVGGPGTEQSYTYDSAYRLDDSVTFEGASVDPIDYEIDGVHNWTNVSGGECPGSYSRLGDDESMNRYTNTGCDSRGYDPKGNLVSIAAGGPGAALGYDFKDRLVSHTVPGTGDWSRYIFDVFGRRARKEVQSGAGHTVTHYAYDRQGRVIEERDAGGASLATYVYAGSSLLPVSMSRGGADYFYLEDHLGSTMTVADAQGNAVERYRYGDFGTPWLMDAAGQPLSVSAVRNPYLFAGQRYDEESGFYHMGRRFMEPKTGRFTSRDPLGTWEDEVGLGNAYTYAANNPQTWTDPTGTHTREHKARGREINRCIGNIFTGKLKSVHGRVYTYSLSKSVAKLTARVWWRWRAAEYGKKYKKWSNAIHKDYDVSRKKWWHPWKVRAWAVPCKS